MSKKQYPSQAYLRQCFRYENGKLFWLTRPREHFASDKSFACNNRFSGNEAGYPRRGRWRIRLNGNTFARSRIIWLLMRGSLPEFIDHINRVQIDDRIENLRPATLSQNGGNSSKRYNNASGYKGVSFNRRLRKYVAQIQVNNRGIYLGLFTTAKEAHDAYVEAATKHFGQYACNG